MAAAQCDQIGRFVALWANFESLWQQLFCPNRPHFKAIFEKVLESFIFLVKSFMGNFYRHLAALFWSHCCCCGDDGRWWTCEKEIFLIERLIQLKIKERDSLGFFFTLRIKDGLWFSSLSPSLSLNHLLACKESHRILVQHSHICN